MIFEFAGFFASVCAIIPDISLFIGSCWLLISIAKDIPTDLSFLTMTNDTHSDINQETVYQRFFAAIQCFSDAKQLSSDIFTSSIIHLFSNCNLLLLLSSDWSTIFKKFSSLLFSAYFYWIYRIYAAHCFRCNFN